MKSLAEILKPETNIRILNIGASFAGEQEPYQKLIDQGLAHCIAFEPNQQECEKLEKMYPVGYNTLQPHFVGDGQQHTFYETNWNLTGSLYEPNNELNIKFNNLAELLQVVAKHTVETIRLDDIGIEDIDYIKIDVQGAEKMIFENAPNLLKNVLAIETEVEFLPLYKNQPLFADVDIELRKHNFLFHTFDHIGMRAFKPLVRNKDINSGFNQMLWADAIYVRDFRKFASLPSSKLKKLAVLLDQVVGADDLCFEVLQLLDKREGGNLATKYLTGK